MPECDRCGSHITPAFVRVFGVNGKVPGCPNCMVTRELEEEYQDG